MVNLQQPGEFIESQSVTAGDHELLRSSTADTNSPETRMVWCGGYLVPRNGPVEYEGEKPVINPAAMIPERPYFVLAFGQKVWAVKEADEAISFYHLPE